MFKVNKNRQWYCLALCILFIILICVGCTASNAASTISEAPYHAEEYLEDQTLRSIRIGDIAYSVQYQSSRRSSFDLEMYHRYTVGSGDPCGSIRVDSEGNWISFSLLYPFDPIMDIESLSEEEVRTAVEAAMASVVDFSVYNTFSLNKIATGYQLLWRLERELPCNIYLIVYLDSDGAIYSVSKTNACPDDLSVPFISTEQRDTLIYETLRNRALRKGEDFNPTEISVTSEMLSLYEGNRAILYSVSVTNNEGFVMAQHIIIMQTENGFTCLY